MPLVGTLLAPVHHLQHHGALRGGIQVTPTHRADPAFGHSAGSGSGAVTAGDYNYSSSLRVSAGPSVERRLAIRPAIV